MTTPLFLLPVCAAGDFHSGSGSADYRDGE
nr:MAG TPA: hypothetical protein [Bacteriophage sp.]